jgi:acid stress chaperone HdeB
MKKLAMALLAASVLLPPAAQAERLDLNTVKCKEWLESGKDNIGITMAWLDGYYKEENDPPVIDFDRMKADATKLATYCAANQDLGLGTAAEKMFGK